MDENMVVCDECGAVFDSESSGLVEADTEAEGSEARCLCDECNDF